MEEVEVQVIHLTLVVMGVLVIHLTLVVVVVLVIHLNLVEQKVGGQE